jgi:MFS superfamily sulfate permease-like transporter
MDAMVQPLADMKAMEQRTASLRFDIVAGLTAAAVVLPKAMAYATVAGLPVAVGLYTAFVPMVIYALLGSSRVLSVSSTTTLAILTGTELGLVVPDGNPAMLVTATATLTALVGAMLLLARLLRLGFVANFISAPVLTGFKAGIGLVIVLDQVPKLLGIPHHETGLLPRSSQRHSSCPRDVAAYAGCGRGDVACPAWHGEAVATLSGAAGCRSAAESPPRGFSACRHSVSR